MPFATVEERRAYDRKWFREHKERKYQYYKEHRDEILQRCRKRYLANREQRLRKAREYVHKHPKRIKARNDARSIPIQGKCNKCHKRLHAKESERNEIA